MQGRTRQIQRLGGEEQPGGPNGHIRVIGSRHIRIRINLLEDVINIDNPYNKPK